MEKRYQRNMSMLSKEEIEKLRRKKVAVIGCGGLGGYIIEMLARLGIGQITAIDGDVFEESNLNRQILSTENVLGKKKAEIAKKRIAEVNSQTTFLTISQNISSENGVEILEGHNLIIDAVDSISTKLLLKELAEKLDIVMIHAAIAGWHGQITTIFPGDKTLDILYSRKDLQGIEKKLGNPSFTPALLASMQVSEALKVILGRGDLLRNKILYIDLYHNEFKIISL